MKKDKGIALVTLILIIIAMIVIAGVVVFIMLKTANSAKKIEGEGTKVISDDNSKSNKKATRWTYNSSTQKYENGKNTYAAGDELTNDEVLKALGISNNTGTYTGTWKVIGIEESKLKLVSTKGVAKVTLGYKDEIANGSQYEYKEDQERGLKSYQRAITTLNEAAQKGTGISAARSINLQDIIDIVGEKGIGSHRRRYKRISWK